MMTTLQQGRSRYGIPARESETGSLALPASYPIEPRTLSQDVKRQGRQADYSSQFSSEVMNERIYTSTPSVSLLREQLPLSVQSTHDIAPP